MNKPKLNSTIQTILVTAFSFLFVTLISYAATTIGTNISTGGTLAVTGTTTLGNASTTQLSVSNNLYTALTANSIPYITTSGLLTQDTSNLVWDGTNNRMGIGTSSPYAKLSIHANNGETNTTLFNIASSTASATTSLFTVLNNGYVGVGTDAPSTKLEVNGSISPSADSTYNLGVLATRRWNHVYANNFVTGTITVSGSGLSAGTRGGKVIIGSLTSGGAYPLRISSGNTSATNGYLTFETDDVERARVTNSGFGIGTSTPTVPFQVATSTANATTTVEFGKANQTKGTCLKLYDAAGVAVYCSVTSSGFACSTTSCE